MDNRITKLASNLLEYSVALQSGENLLIDAKGEKCLPLVKALIKKAYSIGGKVYVHITNEKVHRQMLLGLTEEQATFMAKIDAEQMKEMDAYIRINASTNINELSDVPDEKINLYKKFYMKPVHQDIRLGKKWCVMIYPTEGYAQSSKTSFEAFEDFYFDVCTFDYAKMEEAMKPLIRLMEKTDKVQIKGNGTDLTFSIKDIPVVPCSGLRNIPDGEVYTAPVKDSVNGKITYNCPSDQSGFIFENVCLEFKDGKIIKATANDTDRINKVFDIDEGARYVGEFAIGCNPYIQTPMVNTLFDEKIAGSFHFTPGNCYDVAPNGNKSSLHWDLICIQRAEYGGGEIYFDDVLVRKDGLFVIDELKCLNPENLKNLK